MERSFRSGLILFVGLALTVSALTVRAILLEPGVWSTLLLVAGLALTLGGAYVLRADLVSFFQRRRGEIALYTIGVIGVLVAVAYLSIRFPNRIDMTEQGLFSLSESTTRMLERVDKPVHITFFHDPMMRETVELYELMASKNPLITVEFFDPMVNPAQARMMGVQFAGTAVMQSEGRKLTVNGPGESDIANGILRISRGAIQTICFLDGHGEPDPFSMESHDHMEGNAGHTHGLGAKLVIHERHGMARARGALETMNYTARKVALANASATLDGCAVLVVAGPRSPLLPREVDAVRRFVEGGGNALFMLDPFVETGLEPVVREIGVVLDDDLVIDDASHFWADPSAPAVSDYNRHQITRDLPLSFFPGARSLSPTRERVPNTSAMPLVNSTKTSFGETTRDRASYDEGKDLPGPLTIMAVVVRRMDAHEISGPDGGAGQDGGAETKGKKSRIVVVGDSDFATNSFFHIMGNGNLFLNTVNYLATQENLIGVEPRTYDIPRVNLTNRQMKGTFVLSVILIPALLAFVGTIVWWRQR